MKQIISSLLVAGVFCLLAQCTQPGSTDSHTLYRLRTEYVESPMGMDVKKPRFSWVIQANHRGAAQTAYQVEVGVDPDFTETLWATGKVSSSRQFGVAYDGPDLEPRKRYHWRVQLWDEDGEPGEWAASWFETGMLANENWQANWIYNGKPAPTSREAFYDEHPVPLFRKSFNLDGKVKNARLYIVGLGYCEAFLNGEKIGDRVLEPGWTNYGKEVLYSVYDVTDKLTQRENVLGVMLGNGWYNPLPLGIFRRINLREILTIGRPKVLAELHLEMDDGTTQVIGTDETWKTGDGAILKNNVYLGEYVDARREQTGWSAPGFDASGWNAAVQVAPPGGKLRAQLTPPIRITEKIPAKEITEPAPGVYVVDFGQNFAGWIRMRMQGEPGTKIKLRYGEILYDSGRVNGMTTVAGHIKEIWNLSGGPGAPKTALQEDTYVMKGGDEEVFQHHFTFHGFRYVEITGLPNKPALDDLTGLRLNSDIYDVGDFTCSSELFNQIQKNTEYTMLSNVFSIESDCPGREKFGYGGDMITAGEAYLFNYWMPNFYEKTVRDFVNDQRPNGGMPECAPHIGIHSKGLGEESGPVGWQLAYPFLINELYEFYGNERLVEEQFETVLEVVAHLQEAAGEDLQIEIGIGDHVSLTPKFPPLTSTAFFYHHVKLAEKFAAIVGNQEEQERLSGLASEIKQGFMERFYHPATGQLDTLLTEANQIFGLYYDLIPEEDRGLVFELFKKDLVENQKGHLNTGIFSTKMAFDVFREYDAGGLAFEAVNKRDFPSYGYMIENDATTLWEHWDLQFQNSHNHPMFGSVSEWFYRSVLGINQTDSSTAFRQWLIQPRVTRQLERASGSFEAMSGKVEVDWERGENQLSLSVLIPANSTAIVAIPIHAANATVNGPENFTWESGKQQITENIKPLNKQDEDYLWLHLKSGSYTFDETW